MAVQNILCGILFPLIQNGGVEKWEMRLHCMKIDMDEESGELADIVNEAVLGIGFIPTEEQKGFGVGVLLGYRPYEGEAPKIWEAPHPDNVIYCGNATGTQVFTIETPSSPTEFEFNGIPTEMISRNTLIKYFTKIELPVFKNEAISIDPDELIVPVYPGQSLRNRYSGELCYVIDARYDAQPHRTGLAEHRKMDTTQFGIGAP